MAASRPKILIHYMYNDPWVAPREMFWGLNKEGLDCELFVNKFNPWPKSHDQKNKAEKMMMARDKVLEKGFDYLFNVKDDVILPKNALQALLDAGKHSIGGLMREKLKAYNRNDYVAFVLDPKGPQDSDDRPAEHKKDFDFGEIIQVSKMAIGCWLVDRATLAKVEFKLDDYERYFYDCGAKNIKMFVHTGVRCGHVDIDGTIIKA